MIQNPAANPILEQFPVTHSPYVVLLDHQGHVANISVQPADIRTQIEKIASARRMREGLPDQD